VILAAFGKAAGGMAQAAGDVLGGRLREGIVLAPHGTAVPGGLHRSLRLRRGRHPVPDREGVAATLEIRDMASRLGAEDLFLVLVSGGGSSLLTAPAPGLSLEDKIAATETMLRAGIPIAGVNTVRKHLSLVKGGQLARAAHPARTVTLAISDVIGDPPHVIASGPTVADPSTFDAALEALAGAGLLEETPPSVLRRLRRGAAGLEEETVKEGDSSLAGGLYRVVANNGAAVTSVVRGAREAGWVGIEVTESLRGEAAEAGRVLAREALRRRESLPDGERLCLAGGGETTVTVRGGGVGGRNQELALSFALEVAGQGGITLLSLGTDGIDGPTDAAGAVVDGETVPRALSLGLDPARALRENDSYTLLDAVGCLVRTGPTGTNVMDLQVILMERSTREERA
jgi:glycerate-2-kinase